MSEAKELEKVKKPQLYEVSIIDGKLQETPEVMALFESAKTLYEAKKEIEAQLKAIEAPLKEAILKSPIKSYKNDFFSVSKVAESKRRVILTEMLEADGLLEKYSMIDTTGPSVKITYAKAKGAKNA